jgi:RHO1 GDP-GTP exchange protein 1/2
VEHGSSSRRSSESAQTMPKSNPSLSRRDRGGASERAMSMSAASSSSVRTLLEQSGTQRRSSASSRPPIPSSIHELSSGGRNSPVRFKKSPPVYPAMLSRVAAAFKDRITLGDRLKDGLTYKDAFDGREAVDKIAYIIKTTDRNLALLLGRALDAQKFFHDVTYDHRLRDSANELYQFRTKLPSPFVSGEIANGNSDSPETQEHKEFPLHQSQAEVRSYLWVVSS